MTTTTKTWTREEQAEHRRLWVEALRSGEYEQGMYQLRDSDGRFCCLGVACDISGMDYGHWQPSLPGPMVGWLGVSDDFVSTREGRFLADLNDVGGYTFDQIADVIESGDLLLEGDRS